MSHRLTMTIRLLLALLLAMVATTTGFAQTSAADLALASPRIS